MKMYPPSSSTTIRQRLEQLVARRPKTSKDAWVNVYDNSTEYSSEDCGFYISDYEEFKDLDVLGYRLDSERISNASQTVGQRINLGFTHFRK
jgi:hypothetical protein